MKTFNILSIDWDYFIDASLNQRNLMFPDCSNETRPQFLKDTIWMTVYNNDDLKNIKIDIPAVKMVKEILETSNAELYQITNSHGYAYPFIKAMVENETESTRFNLINVDFHHDLYKTNESDSTKSYNKMCFTDENVNCGNWLHYIIERYKERGTYTWIKREDSDIEDIEKYPLNITTDLSIIKDVKWDAIFICKSDMWSPPHLDKKFNVLTKSVRQKIDNGVCGNYEEAVFNDRFTEEFKHLVEEEKMMRKKMSQELLRETGEQIEKASKK